MDKLNFDLDESALLARFDRSSPEALLRSIAAELIRLQRAQAQLTAKMEVFVSLQAATDRIAAAERDAPGPGLPTRMVIDPTQSFADSTGFHGLEHDPEGQPYRWTGPNPRFSFSFFVNRGATAKFVLRFGPLYAGVSPRGLACFVDGEPVQLHLQAATNCFEAVGTMPVRQDSGGTVLTFVCPAMASPASKGLDDTRVLGLLFRRLTIESLPEAPARVPTGTIAALAAPTAPAVPLGRGAQAAEARSAGEKVAAGQIAVGQVAAPHAPPPPSPLAAPKRSTASEGAFQEISFKGAGR